MNSDIVFAEEISAGKPELTEQPWKILVVDDEKDVHEVTRFALEGYVYRNRELSILSAYSAAEARRLCAEHEDIAVILLDVVMETHTSGLELAEYIRNTLHNRLLRIILRTGQPGHAPEKQVILKYEINDYQNKTELSNRKLFTVITAALRAYSDLLQLESYRRHLEYKVAERTKELIRLNKEKDEFLGIAAHDLKNPLSVIQVISEEIETSFDDLSDAKLLDFVRTINLSAAEMFDLVTKLLDVNAIEAGRMYLCMGTVNAVFSARYLIDAYRSRAADKQLRLHFETAGQNLFVAADEKQLAQVMDNLISNAIKYSPPGRDIFVRVYPVETGVRLEVEDQGQGLTPEDRQKLFGKFARLSPRPTANEHSTGLGLFIVKKLTEAMNGKVWCDTAPGQGCKFTVELPLADDASDRAPLPGPNTE